MKSTFLTSHHINLRQPIRTWPENIEVFNTQMARFLCWLIPAQCPFARDINVFGKRIVRIPPLCKLNPLYDRLMELRFKSLSYLVKNSSGRV